MLGTHSELCRGQMSHICDISPLRVINIPKSLITKCDNLYCIREYGSTPYIGMAWKQKMAAIHLNESDDLKSLLIHTDTF